MPERSSAVLFGFFFVIFCLFGFAVCFLPVQDFNPWTSTPTHPYSITDVKHQPLIAIKTQETAINVAFKFLYFSVSHFC